MTTPGRTLTAVIHEDNKVKMVRMAVGDEPRTAAFLPDGEHIVSGGKDGIILQQVEDRQKRSTTIKSGSRVLALAVVHVSNAAHWIVGGMENGMIMVWDGSTHKTIYEMRGHKKAVKTIDVSSDSKKVVTGSDDWTAIVWDMTTGEQQLASPLQQDYTVVAVRFCPCGDRVAVATLYGSIRIHDCRSGDKLIDIPVTVTSDSRFPNTPLVWSTNGQRIFALSPGYIRCLDAASGTSLSQWKVDSRSDCSSIALASNGKFIAYSTGRTVTLWDTSSHQQIGRTLEHGANILCITLSAGNNRLAGGGIDEKITVWDLRTILPDPYFTDASARASLFSQSLRLTTETQTTVNEEPCLSHKQEMDHRSHFTIPLMQINNTAIKPWLYDDLTTAEAVFSEEIAGSSSPSFNVLANRALTLARSKQWDAALRDARRSLEVQPSPIGYIALVMAFISQGDNKLALQEIDCVLTKYDSHEKRFLLLLIKSITLFVCGNYNDGISFVNKHINDAYDSSLHHLVQAKMYLEREDYRHAIQSFDRAQMFLTPGESPELQTISLIFGWKFDDLGINIHKRQCEALLTAGSVDATACLHRMMKTFTKEVGVRNGEVSSWILEFKSRCATKFETLGDEALKAKKYNEASEHYSAVLSLEPRSPHGLYLKRSEAFTAFGSLNNARHTSRDAFKNALKDADEAITLDPSSPWGYEKKHAALHGLNRYDEAVEALNEMLSKMQDSPDPRSRELRRQGINPTQNAEAIRKIVTHALRDSPLALIDTETGYLYDKPSRIRLFEAHPDYSELVLKPPSQISDALIGRAVERFFRYSTLSHTWEGREPLFHDVLHRSVYDLPPSRSHTKLRRFCEEARKNGYGWAWSDTCCIDKTAGPVLQESLTSMYRWYYGSSLTLVHLRGVSSQPDLDTLVDALVHCMWNTRAWTLQEYFASTVIRFYTEDWQPYLPHVTIFNHKEVPEITRQMALATGIEEHVLASLRPGSDNVRQKLRLASKRTSTKLEDTAYSLFGILDVSMPPIYGEGHKALGRLLEVVLSRSGDATILAWTGKASEYNSCLPADIAVYHESPSSHLPSPVDDIKMETSVSALRTSQIYHEPAMQLYDRVDQLPSPRLFNTRLSLPCIVFPLTIDHQSTLTEATHFVYTATASPLGKVMIKTSHDLSRSVDGQYQPDNLERLVLVHPWLRSHLDPNLPSSNKNEGGDGDHPRQVHQVNRFTRALRLFVRLREPFGALLLRREESPQEFRRVASDELIKVQIQAEVSPLELMDKVIVVDIL